MTKYFFNTCQTKHLFKKLVAYKFRLNPEMFTVHSFSFYEINIGKNYTSWFEQFYSNFSFFLLTIIHEFQAISSLPVIEK